MRAATQQSAENNSFALPIAVQHLSLMILVNVTIAAAGASKVGRAHSQLLLLTARCSCFTGDDNVLAGAA